MSAHDEIVRLYGPWRSRSPHEAAEFFADYPGRWWIAGGWAIEAFAGTGRRHGDLDLGIPGSEVTLLQEHVRGRLDVWAADGGTLTPLRAPVDPLRPLTCTNLWLRASGADPWEYDVLLMDGTSTTWVYRRDDRIGLPLEEILWSSDGITYLSAEVQLLHKAPGARAKDQEDFDACLPRLDPAARRWLRAAIDTAHPGHPWLDEL